MVVQSPVNAEMAGRTAVETQERRATPLTPAVEEEVPPRFESEIVFLPSLRVEAERAIRTVVYSTIDTAGTAVVRPVVMVDLEARRVRVSHKAVITIMN